MGIFCLFWGFFIEPNLLFVKNYHLKSNKLAGLKIVFLSDIHAAINDENRLERIVKIANAQNADLVFLGGDFINGHKQSSSLSVEIIAQKLAGLKNEYGIFSVLGNHDWYLDGKKVRKELEKVGIVVLENENQTININGQDLTIAGIADDATRNPDPIKTFAGSSDSVILLTHSPDTFPDIDYQFELALAGHTHGGQIVIPFLGAPISNSFYGQDYLYGLIEQNNKKMIVTKGLGTSVLPLRFFCSPEIVVVDFEAAE